MNEEPDFQDAVDEWITNPLKLIEESSFLLSPIKLFSHQKLMLDLLLNNKKTLTVLPRGAGKTFSMSLFAYIKFMLSPTTRIGLFSISQRQSNKLLDVVSDVIDQTQIWSGVRTNFLVDRIQRLKSQTYSELVALPHDPSTVLGEHPDVLCMDECGGYPTDEIYFKVLKPMLMGVQTVRYTPELHLASVLYKADGFFYNLLQNAERLGFKVLCLDWTHCDPTIYDPIQVAKDRRELGEEWYQAQMMCNPQPLSGVPFPFDLIEKNVGEPEYLGSAPTIGGIDLGKKRDYAAVILLQEKNDVLHLVSEYKGQWDYSLLAKECVQMSEGFKASSFLVDTTTGEEFVDFGRQPPYNLPLKTFSFGGGKGKGLIDFLHIQMENGRLVLSDDSELVADLKRYRFNQHLPDLVAALGLAVWNFYRGGEEEEKVEYFTPLSR